MSAIETDLNPDAFVGLSFPLKVGSNYDFQMTKTVVEQSVHNLRNLLLTYPGERVAQPTFGSRLRDLCFEPVDDDLPVNIKFSTSLSPQDVQETTVSATTSY